MRRVQINSAGTPPLAVIRRQGHDLRAADRPCSNATTTQNGVRKFTSLNWPNEWASGQRFVQGHMREETTRVAPHGEGAQLDPILLLTPGFTLLPAARRDW